MMTRKTYLLWILLPLLFSSCEDFFRTAVKVDPPPFQEGLVVNFYIDDTDTLLKASVSRNVSSLETMKDRSKLLLPDATVLVLDEEGNVVADMDTVMPMGGDDMINFVTHLNAPFGGNGHRFRLQVSHPGYKTITAEQTMPRKPEISHPLLSGDAGYDDYGGGYYNLTFDIKDPPGEQNYYMISAFFVNPGTGYRMQLSVESNNPLIEYSYGWESLLLRDRTFDGESYPLTLQLYGLYPEDPAMHVEDYKVFVDIRMIARDYYLYSVSLRKASDAEDLGFFIEPVQVYDNIENGLGIFALSARSIVLAGKE